MQAEAESETGAEALTNALAAGLAGVGGGGAGAHRGDRRRSEVAATLEPMEDEAVDDDLFTI
jgi:hypothetical protein